MTAETQTRTLAERLQGTVSEAETFVPERAMDTVRDGIETVRVPAARFADAAQGLRDVAGFTRFIDITCVDDPDRTERFEVSLLVYSTAERRWARLKTRTAGRMPSVTPIFFAALNYERELFDLFGIFFDGHPRLTRILLPDEWVGHPLRRDAPAPLEPTDFTVTRDLYKT